MPIITAALGASVCSSVCIVGAVIVGNYVLVPIAVGTYTKIKRSIFDNSWHVLSFALVHNGEGTLSLLKYVSSTFKGQNTVYISDDNKDQLPIPTDQWFKKKIGDVMVYMRVNTTNPTKDPRINGTITGVTLKCKKNSSSREELDKVLPLIIKEFRRSKPTQCKLS